MKNKTTWIFAMGLGAGLALGTTVGHYAARAQDAASVMAGYGKRTAKDLDGAAEDAAATEGKLGEIIADYQTLRMAAKSATQETQASSEATMKANLLQCAQNRYIISLLEDIKEKQK